jgi:hypothetical protein
VASRAAKRVRPGRKIAVGFLGAQAHFTGELIDLSESGVLVRTSEKPKLQTVGRVGIDVGMETFRAAAIVSRNVPNVGVAFQFGHMTPHNRQLLRRLLLHLEAGAAF